jgi:ribosome biogenesis GTPase A
MDELQLLRTALTALDDVFMVVVVGEFNSGKSTVINALLGEKFLAEGVLPTTNEITVLKYADPATRGPNADKPELVQQADGLFWRYLPAELLKEMNIVDTPGEWGAGLAGDGKKRGLGCRWHSSGSLDPDVCV